MHNFAALLRFKLKNVYVNPVRKLLREKAGVLKLIGLGALMLIGFAPLFGMYFGSVWMMAPVLKVLGAEKLILTMAMTVAQLVILVFSVYAIGSEFYYTKESDMLMTLPFKAEETFLAKFVALFLSEVLLSAAAILPAVFSYARVSDVGALYYIGGVFAAITAPILPMAFLLLVTTLLMRVISRSAGKTITQTLMFVFIMAIAIGIQFVSRNVGEQMSAGLDPQATVSTLSRFDMLSRIFFTAYLSVEMLTGSWIMGIALVASYVGLFALLAWFARTMYYTTLMNNKSESTKKAKITGKSYRSNGQIAAIFKKDWMRTVRTPIFLLTTFSSAFIFVILFFVPAIQGLKSESDGMNFAMFWEQFRVFAGENPWLIRIAFGLFLGAIFGFSSGTSSILFSREGKNYWIHRVLPIDPKNEACARYLYGLSVSAAPVLVLLTLFSVFVWFDPILIVLSVILATIVLSPSILAVLYTDACKPDLSWEDPAKMGKKNFRAVLLIYAVIAVYVGLGFLFFFTYRSLGLLLATGLVLLIFMMISFVFAQRLVVQLRNGIDL